MTATFFELVVRFGYRRATVDDVARICRVSKRTVYERFPSKEALYEAALTQWARGQRKSVQARLTTTAPAAQVRELIALAFADARAASDVAPPPTTGVDEPLDLVIEVNERVFAPMVLDLIRRGNVDGSWHVEDPETTARFCIAVGVEAINQLRRDPTRDLEPATAAAMLRLLGAPEHTTKQRTRK
ncbi:MAG: helix-turn-helix domain-containing protein [Tetrasphaera sp.]